jgi:hypothetical protein
VNNGQQTERAEILRVLDDYHAAMVGARTDILESLLDKDFALVHITGYVQPRAEWLDVVRSGAFDYHAIQMDELSLNVEVMSNTAVLKGRGIFNATITGMKNLWRLQFTMKLAQQKGRWRFMHAKYKSY